MSNFSTIVDSNIKYSRGCLGGTQCRSTINPVSMGLYFEVWTSTGRHIQQDEWFLSQMSIQYLCNVSTGCYKFLRVDKALADGAYISPLLREVDVMISRPSFSSRIHLRATSHQQNAHQEENFTGKVVLERMMNGCFDVSLVIKTLQKNL